MAIPRSVDRAKSVITKTFNTTAIVYRKTVVVDDMGGQTDSYDAVGTYPCSFSRYPITPLERENTVTLQAISTWLFVFAYGTQIYTSDRLYSKGRTFEVVASATGSLEIAARVLCTEIT